MENGKISPTNSSSIDTISILVVDDDITCLSIVAAILKKFKYEVVTVKHPNDALCTLRIKGGAFDLVVSDVHMPDMNGFELQQAIAQEFNLPVVLMSADDKEGVALKGLECGAAFFIMKPVSADDLRDLWQFAAMKRKNINHREKNSREIVYEDGKGKSPKKERCGEKSGENSQSSSQKRPKIVWTNSLHNRFLEAIRSIGLDRAVPKKILEVMNVPGLTRENVASHLQKYRIFLRRVSDASYKIQYSSHKGLIKLNSESSRISTLTPNTLTKLTYQNPPMPHIESTTQSRLLSNSASWPNLVSCQNDRPHVRLVQNDCGAHTSIRGHLASITLKDHPNVLDDAIYGQQSMGRPDVTSPLSSNNLTYQTNYVGYSIRNIANLSSSDHDLQSNTAITVPASASEAGNDSNIDLDLLTKHAGNSNSFVAKTSGREQLCDVIADYRMQLPLVSTPIFDIPEFDIFSAQQAMEQGCLGTNLQNHLTIQNQEQLNHGGGSSNFYGDMVHWDNFVDVPYSLDQAQNQIQNTQMSISQGFGTSSQLNGTLLLPTNEQQVLEGLEFGTYAQLSKSFVSPTHERNDDDFLESLLAPFAEEHCLQGSNM